MLLVQSTSVVATISLLNTRVFAPGCGGWAVETSSPGIVGAIVEHVGVCGVLDFDASHVKLRAAVLHNTDWTDPHRYLRQKRNSNAS